MLRRRLALFAVLLLLFGKPIPLFAQPASTPLPAENCENCVDDDGDGDIDRADTSCAPPIDGANAGIGDVGTGVERQHFCAVDRVVGAAVPRAAELLTFAGRDVASEFPCLVAGADGGNAGVSEPDRKPVRRCDDAIQKAAQRLLRARLKSM